MSDDETIKVLKAELERQRQEQEQRHQALVAELQRRDARPLRPSDARQAIRDGYAASTEARAAAKAAKVADPATTAKAGDDR